MHATGLGLERYGPARNPVVDRSTRLKASGPPKKEHSREEHSENATFLRKRQRNVTGDSGEMTVRQQEGGC